ncbi:MAG: ECF-type sigma factor [Phycisphaerales bacterium]|jgi:RNA polymerase sigma factor (TIGR02999 family)|nr:ECF-type sigma factor [Phycisphaerales bacterium]
MDRLDEQGLTRVIDDAFANRPQGDARFDAVYERLRAMAVRMVEHDRAGRDLGATDLVHEAYMRLHTSGQAGWRDRRQFFAAASEAMRRVLVDHARHTLALKRGGGRARVPIDALLGVLDDDSDAAGSGTSGLERTMLMDEVVAHAEGISPEHAEALRLRFFGGLGFDAIGELQGVSERQARRRCEAAVLALRDGLEGEGAGG